MKEVVNTAALNIAMARPVFAVFVFASDISKLNFSEGKIWSVYKIQ
jgi:hypothetical protein